MAIKVKIKMVEDDQGFDVETGDPTAVQVVHEWEMECLGHNAVIGWVKDCFESDGALVLHSVEIVTDAGQDSKVIAP